MSYNEENKILRGENKNVIAWEVKLSLLDNPVVMGQLIRVVIFAGLLMAIILSFILAVTGEFRDIPFMLAVSLVFTAGSGLFFYLMVLIFFRRPIRVRFTVDERGVLQETVDMRARAVSRLAVLLGITGRSPQAAGGGLLVMSREKEFIPWKSLAAAEYNKRHRMIVLRNSWRAVAMVACSSENYDLIAAYIRQYISAPDVTGPADTRNPVRKMLLRTLLVMSATVPLFTLPYPFEPELFMALVLFFFALATVWLIPFFGWVVIGAALFLAVEIVVTGMEVKESMFAWRGMYRNFEMASGGEWLHLFLALAGLAYLVWFSRQALRGRVRSALTEE